MLFKFSRSSISSFSIVEPTGQENDKAQVVTFLVHTTEFDIVVVSQIDPTKKNK